MPSVKMKLLNIPLVELSEKVLGRIYFLKDEMHCTKHNEHKTILKILSMFITIHTHLLIVYSL